MSHCFKSLKACFLAVCCIFTFSVTATDDVDYHYTGNVTINPKTGLLTAKWRIDILKPSKADLNFMLRDTLSNIKLAGPALTKQMVEISTAGNDLQKISLNIYEDMPLKDRYITVSYSGVLLPTEMGNKINHIGMDYIELNVDSFWFPINAEFNKKITAKYSVNVGQQWQAIATGDVTYDQHKIIVNNTTPFLDISMTLAPKFNEIKGDGFTLYDLRQKPVRIEMLKKAVSQCYAFLNDNFGKSSPLPNGRFILHDRPSSGYARQAYIALSSITKSRVENLTGFVCHELAHYWSGYGKFDTVENWLNEGLAVYTELMAVRHIFGQDEYNNWLVRFKKQIVDKNLPSVWTKQDQSRRPYLVNYRKSPLILADLEKRIGTPLFLKFFTRYMDEKVSTTPDLIVILQQVAGTAHSNWFIKRLGQ